MLPQSRDLPGNGIRTTTTPCRHNNEHSKHKKIQKANYETRYHQSKTAASGFTKDHMESFIHLGTYALGALSNQHGLAPDAPHEDEDESAMA